MIEAMGLKIIASRSPLEWHYLRTKFHENLPSGSKVVSWGGGGADRPDLMSLILFLESRLKINNTYPQAYVKFVTGLINSFQRA
jgi:hypothetical protein